MGLFGQKLIVMTIAILFIVYPLEGLAKRRYPLVRIHHTDPAASSSGSVSESYNASRNARARRDATENVQSAQRSLDSARARELRIQSEGPSSQSPNSHYRNLMDSQGDRYRAESDLREQQNREYWERRR